MKRHYLLPLAGLLSLGLAACGGANEPSSKLAPGELPMTIEAAEDARLAAVKIYADWCSSCKVLDPKVDAVRSNNTFPATSFITLDYTSRDKELLLEAADAAGVGAPIRAQFESGVTTGILLLVDLDDQSIVADLRKELSEAEMAAAITAAEADA